MVIKKHNMGTTMYTAKLMLYWFGFNQTSKLVDKFYIPNWLNSNQPHSMSAIVGTVMLPNIK